MKCKKFVDLFEEAPSDVIFLNFPLQVPAYNYLQVFFYFYSSYLAYVTGSSPIHLPVLPSLLFSFGEDESSFILSWGF